MSENTENADEAIVRMGYRTVRNARRAEIGAARRAKSRNTILTAAFACYGRADGRIVRIEDICKAAGVARGTFYNHFDDLEALRYQLLEEMTRECLSLAVIPILRWAGGSRKRSSPSRICRV